MSRYVARINVEPHSISYETYVHDNPYNHWRTDGYIDRRELDEVQEQAITAATERADFSKPLGPRWRYFFVRHPFPSGTYDPFDFEWLTD